MSTDVTMQELELETAELLPARETLCCFSHHNSARPTSPRSAYGNTAQAGLINVSVAQRQLQRHLNNAPVVPARPPPLPPAQAGICCTVL